MSPTAATEAAKGATTVSVWKSKGTLGRWNAGSAPETAATSPTVFAAAKAPGATTFAKIVTRTMAASGAGICLGQNVSAAFFEPSAFISSAVIAVNATCAYSAAPARFRNDASCAPPMTMARPLTKPIMHVLGTSRMSLPSLAAPHASWMTPAMRTAANRYSGPWFATSGANTTAVAPAAPLMTPGCAPRMAVDRPMSAAAWSPQIGETPATNVNASDSGTIARETVMPARIWPRMG